MKVTIKLYLQLQTAESRLTGENWQFFEVQFNVSWQWIHVDNAKQA